MMMPANPSDWIENRTFDEIQIGDVASLSRTLGKGDIDLFAVMSGDVNPAHMDEEFAKSDIFREVIAHGMWGGALISTVLGTQMPGLGTIYLAQSLRFSRPVKVGDTLTVTVVAKEKVEAKRRITFDCQCINQHGETVITGAAEVIAPAEKIKRPRIRLPDVKLIDKYARYRDLLARTAKLEPVVAAVVHPCDVESLTRAIEAAKAGLIKPLIVGPEARIRALALKAGIDLLPYMLVPAEHSHDAADKAVAFARSGQAEMLVQGSLSLEELMAAVRKGLHTKNRASHVFVMDVPSYPRPLFITDSAINIEPDLDTKRDIVQHAIHLARVLGLEIHKVAILAAEETVHANLRSTTDAAALCKMAERGQITGGLLDGPLAFDNAVSALSAHAKHLESPVAGVADILVVPDLESGNMLAKQLLYFADSQAAGVVVGTRAPIALASVGDTPLSGIAACAVAMLLAHHFRENPP